MSDEPLPPALRELIRWHVESIDHMELLVLLHRTAPRAWTVEELAQELHLPVRTTFECVTSLVRGELVLRVGDMPTGGAGSRFRFAPRTDALANAVELLAREYDERPVALVTAVRSRPSVVLQSFADAFRVKRKP